MLEQLYAYKEKYEKEVKSLEEQIVLAKAKVSVVCDMIADNEPKEETPTHIDETY
jgi:hypothetical protein